MDSKWFLVAVAAVWVAALMAAVCAADSPFEPLWEALKRIIRRSVGMFLPPGKRPDWDAIYRLEDDLKLPPMEHAGAPSNPRRHLRPATPTRHRCSDDDAAHTCPDRYTACEHTCPVVLPVSRDRPKSCRHCGDPIEYDEIVSVGAPVRYLPQMHTCDPEQRAIVDRWNAESARPVIVLPPGADMHYLSAEDEDRVRIEIAGRFAQAQHEQEHR